MKVIEEPNGAKTVVAGEKKRRKKKGKQPIHTGKDGESSPSLLPPDDSPRPTSLKRCVTPKLKLELGATIFLLFMVHTATGAVASQSGPAATEATRMTASSSRPLAGSRQIVASAGATMRVLGSAKAEQAALRQPTRASVFDVAAEGVSSPPDASVASDSKLTLPAPAPPPPVQVHDSATSLLGRRELQVVQLHPVSPGHNTLKTAYNAASPGDTLVLADGTYTNSASRRPLCTKALR